MENAMVSMIGIAALGYAGYRVWQNISGKQGCNCGGSCSNSNSNCCAAHKK